MRGWAQWQALDDEIAWFDRQIAEHASHDRQAQRFMDVCDVGRLTASAAVATVVDARQFKNGRQMAAWLAIVPSQKSSGGKQRLGRITKQGKDYLRALLFQGARSAILTAHRRHNRLSRWIVQLQARVACKELSRRRLCPGKTDNSHMPARPESWGTSRDRPAMSAAVPCGQIPATNLIKRC